MARYRKIDPRIWNDEKFRNLSDDGQLIFLFVLTHPHMTSLGAMRATVAGLAAEKQWPVERFEKAFGEGLAEGMLEASPEASFVGVPRFLKYNRPESPNVVKAWASQWDLIPECNLKADLAQRVKAFAEGLSKAFGEAFREAFPKAMPYQEQERDRYAVSPEQDRPAVGPLDGEEGPPASLIDWEHARDTATPIRWKLYPGRIAPGTEALLIQLAAVSQGDIPPAWLPECVEVAVKAGRQRGKNKPKHPAKYLLGCLVNRSEGAGIDLPALLKSIEIPPEQATPLAPSATQRPPSPPPVDPEPIGKLVGSDDVMASLEGRNTSSEPAEVAA